MAYSRARMADWYWGGGPNRRLLFGLFATLVVVGVPYLAKSPTPLSFIWWLIGWDFGAWFMDKMYIQRQSQRPVTAG